MQARDTGQPVRYIASEEVDQGVDQLRFFAGVAQADIARMLGVSERTVERDWLKARIVLLDALGRR